MIPTGNRVLRAMKIPNQVLLRSTRMRDPKPTLPSKTGGLHPKCISGTPSCHILNHTKNCPWHCALAKTLWGWWGWQVGVVLPCQLHEGHLWGQSWTARCWGSSNSPELSSHTIPAGSALAIASKCHGKAKYTQELETALIYLCSHSLRGEMGLHRGDSPQQHPRAQQLQINTSGSPVNSALTGDFNLPPKISLIWGNQRMQCKRCTHWN